MAIPGDGRIEDKELEITKYQDLKIEDERLWHNQLWWLLTHWVQYPKILRALRKLTKFVSCQLQKPHTSDRHLCYVNSL